MKIYAFFNEQTGVWIGLEQGVDAYQAWLTLAKKVPFDVEEYPLDADKTQIYELSQDAADIIIQMVLNPDFSDQQIIDLIISAKPH